MRNFEIYKRSQFGNRKNPHATVTVQRRGWLSFSPAAIEALGSPESVTLLFDQAEHLIGFRKASPEKMEAYPVRATKGTHVVSALDFCRFLGLDLSESRRYALLSENGVHYINLKQPGLPVTSNRRKY